METKTKSKNTLKIKKTISSSSSRKKPLKITKSINDTISDSNVIVISKPSAPKKLFHSHPKTAYHLSRYSFRQKQIPDKIIEFINDYLYELNQGKTIDAKIIEQKIFNHEPENCICQNINANIQDTNNNKPLNNDCACSNLKVYSRQGKSGASINSIECNGVKDILKVVPLGNYYIKKRVETKKYIFLEMDGFTIQTIINTYVYRELPLNTVAINNSGVCIKEKSRILGKNYLGYNLMAEANMGSGEDFIAKLLQGKLDDEFGITSGTYGRDTRYKMFVNFILQVICILGHLQSSSLEFFHGDYKPDNVFVKRLDTSNTKHYNFNISGIPIKIPNMGFAVLIADFVR